MQIPKETSSLQIKVIPRARKTEWAGIMDDGTWKLRVHAVPEDGEANDEILRFLEKETGEKWEIVSGFTNSRKGVRRTIS